MNNNRPLKKGFVFHMEMTKRLSALVYAMEGREIEPDAIRHAYDLIKKSTGMFSTFRGNLAVYIAAMLALTDDPQGRLDDTLDAYNLLKSNRFYPSDHLVAASYELAGQGRRDILPQLADRSREFFMEMKSNIRFHVGQDDYIFAAMLALSDLDVHDSTLRIRNMFTRLKPEFSRFIGRNSVLALAQIMVLGGEKGTDACVYNMLHLNRTLRDQGIRLDKAYVLPSLGVLTLLNNANLAHDINFAQTFLRGQKGFGRFSVGNQEIMLYVTALVANGYARGINKASVSTSITNLIIAQQAAMMAATMTATTAAAASS